MKVVSGQRFGEIARVRFAPLLAFFGCMTVAVPLTPQGWIVLFDAFCVLVITLRLKDVLALQILRRVLTLFVLYSGLLFLSGVLHGLPLVNFVRRDYGAFLLVVEAIGIYLLLADGGFRRHLLVISAFMLGICFHLLWPSDDRILEDPIKFLVGVPLGVLIGFAGLVMAGTSPTSRFVIAALYLAYAAFCVLNGYRSNAAVFMLVALIATLPLGIGKGRSYRKLYPWVVIGGLAGLYLVTELYAVVAMTGAFGERQAGIAEFQKQAMGSLLLGGRPEIAINLLAIWDSPLIGHGPIAQTPRYLEAFALLGIYSDSDLYLWLENDQMLYHSMLFAAGHEAGIVAMVFWAYLAHRLIFVIPIVATLGRRVSLLVLPIILMALWHVLFSPLNGYSRWIVAAGIALAIYWAERWREYAAESRPAG